MIRPRHVASIVHVDLLRRYRAVRADRRQFAALLLAAVVGGVPLVGTAVTGTYVFGTAVAAGTVAEPAAFAAPAGAAVVAGLAVLVALRTAQQGAAPAHPDGLLTTVRHGEAAVAVFASELAVSGGIAGVPAVVAAAAFGVGAGSPAAAVTAALGALAAVGLAVLLGFVAGLAVRNAFARSATLARYRVAIGAAVLLAYFGVVLSQSESDAFLPLVAALAATPAGWFGHLAVVPLGGRPALAAGAVGTFLVGGAVLLAVVVRLTAALWYVEPARPARHRGVLARIRSRLGGDASPRLGGVPGLGRQTGRVVRKTWRRALRNPIRLVYVAYPLLLLYAPVARSLRTGEVPATLAPLVALYGAWAVGAAFTLNPLGDEGNVLPVTLTTPIDGRRFVGALCLAALLIGLPLVTLATLGAALAGGLSPAAAGVTALAGAVVTTAGTGIAAGVGALFPRLEAVRVTRSREAVVPSLLAFASYSFVVGVVGLPATLAGVTGVPDTVATVTGVGRDAVVVAGVGTTAVLGAVAAVAGFVYAARRFDRFAY